MSTPMSQCEAGFSALGDYFRSINTYYTTGGTVPDSDAASTAMDYDDVLTFVVGSATRGADYSIGAGVEVVSHFAGILRELDIINLGKTELYSNAASEALEEAAFCDQNSVFLSSVMKGVPTTGSQC
jgi:hypothetical protein